MSRIRYTKLPYEEKDFKSLCSFFTAEGTAQRPECDAPRGNTYVVGKREFNRSIKILSKKIKNLPLEQRKRQVCFYVAESGMYVAEALGLPAHRILMKKDSISVPISILSEIVKECRAHGYGEAEILVLDDIFDSGATAAKIFLAMSKYFVEKKTYNNRSIITNLTFAVSIRRKQEYERDSYGFSTIDFNAIPRCKLLYGVRSRSMKYFKMPWEELQERCKAKRRKK